jgi:hypothetical protein
MFKGLTQPGAVTSTLARLASAIGAGRKFVDPKFIERATRPDVLPSTLQRSLEGLGGRLAAAKANYPEVEGGVGEEDDDWTVVP